jgi:hypothetical protein
MRPRWNRVKPGVYRCLTEHAVGAIDQGASGYWWWLVTELVGDKVLGAGTALYFRSARMKANDAMERSLGV